MLLSLQNLVEKQGATLTGLLTGHGIFNTPDFYIKPPCFYYDLLRKEFEQTDLKKS